MIARLASLLRARIEALSYVDRVAGLVRPITYEREEGKVTIPVALDGTTPDCSPEQMQDMVPDERYACMVYFEDRGGIQRTQHRTRGISFSAKLRLVCWVNTQKFASDPMATDRIQQQMVAALQTMPYNWGTLVGIREVVEGIPQRGSGLFSAYTYPESARQYLMAPFDAFAIDIAVEFRLSKGCDPDVELQDDACWSPPAPGPAPTPPAPCPVVRVCDVEVGQGIRKTETGWEGADWPDGGGGQAPVKDNVRVSAAAPANVDLSLGIEPGADIDGYTAQDGDLVVLMFQDDPSENGVYVVQSGSPAQRADGYDTWDALVALLVLITNGDTYGGQAWVSTTTAGGTLGVDPVPFEEYPQGAQALPLQHGAGPLYTRQAGTYSGNPIAGTFRADFITTSGITRLTFAHFDADGQDRSAELLALAGGGAIMAFSPSTGASARFTVSNATGGVSKVSLVVAPVSGVVDLSVGSDWRWLIMPLSDVAYPGGATYLRTAGDPDVAVPPAGYFYADATEGAYVTLFAFNDLDFRGETQVQYWTEPLSALTTMDVYGQVWLDLHSNTGKTLRYVVTAIELEFQAPSTFYWKIAVGSITGYSELTPIVEGERWYPNVWWGMSVPQTPTIDTGITQLTGDVTAGPGDGSQTSTIADNAVSNAKAADMAEATIKGRASGAGTGDPTDLTATQVRAIINVADGANAYIHPNHSGDVISTGDGATAIAADVVDNTKLSNMAQATVKGRAAAAGTGDPADLSANDLSTILDAATDPFARTSALPASGLSEYQVRTRIEYL